MFGPPSAIQELLRRCVGRPIRLDLAHSPLRCGVRAAILSGETADARPAPPAGG